MDKYFREPLSAAAIAAGITAGYVYFKNKMNGQRSEEHTSELQSH